MSGQSARSEDHGTDEPRFVFVRFVVFGTLHLHAKRGKSIHPDGVVALSTAEISEARAVVSDPSMTPRTDVEDLGAVQAPNQIEFTGTQTDELSPLGATVRTSRGHAAS